MARLQTFQRHAITAPVFDKTKLHRRRLVQILQDNLWRKLILVVAPAGYGKTMLLADLTAHTDRRVCWVRLTEHDRDAMRLARAVADSVDSKFPKARLTESLGVLRGVSPNRVGHAMGAAIGTALSDDLVLVLDDFHVAGSSKEAIELLLGLAGDTPPNLHIVVSSREMPDLPLAVPSARDRVYTIASGDLAVTEEEAAELLKVYRAAPTTPDAIRTLLIDTRGWIAGIALLTLHGLGGERAGLATGKDLAFEYFASEVLNNLPVPVKSDVVKSSVLPIMTASAVEGVLAIEQGGPWLRRLAQKGLFVSASAGTPKIYEYHPLFRQFLLEELHRTLRTSELKKLMTRAANYLAKHGGENDAIDLYEAAGQPVKAIRVAERASGTKLKNGEEGTLRKWVALADKYDLPAVQLRVAFIETGWAESSLGTVDAIRRTLRRFRKRISRIDALGLEAYLAWALTERTLGGPARMARAILREVGVKDNHRAGRLAHAVLAWANLVRERSLDDAERDARAALRAARCHGARTSVAHMRNLLVWVLVARGKSREAEEIDGRFSFAASGWRGFIDAIEPLDRAYWAHRNLDWGIAIKESQTGVLNAERLVLEDFVQIGIGVRASILSDIGARRLALNILERTDMAFWKRYPLWLTDFLLTHIQARRRQGDLGGARSWLRRARSLPQPYKSSTRFRLEMILCNQDLSPEDATARLVSLIRQTRMRTGPVLTEVLAELFIGWNYWRNGLIREGLRYSRSAIRLAYKSGNLAPVCAELAALPRFMAHLQAHLVIEEATRKLWEGIDHAKSALKNLALAERGAAAIGSIELVALGNESIMVGETRVHLKPLFAELLYYVVDKVSVSRDELLETFWPGKSLGRQRQGLNAAVYAIRKALGKDAVRIQGDAIVCSEGLSEGYDARRFELLAKRIARSRAHGGLVLDDATRALSWYGGPFLPGHSRQWAIDRRAELDVGFRAIVAEYTTACIAQGRAADAAKYAMSALTYDPLDELSAILVAKVHLAMGRRAHARQVLAEFRVAFTRELGLNPSKELLSFEDTLLRDGAPQDGVSDQFGTARRAGSVGLA